MIPSHTRRARSSLRIATTLCICIAVLALTTAAHAAPRKPAPRDAEAAARFGARVDSLRVAAHIPGLAVVVLRDTSVVLARGMGLADLERKIAVTPETPFDIASVSKTTSAVVALKLVELELLDRDRPMTSFADFSEFCQDAKGRGGIFFGDYTCDSTLTLRHVMSMEANGKPGTRFWYNPPSYSWASRPMQQVAGSPFSTLVAKYVFEPAGMLHSARRHRALPLRADLAAELAKPYQLDSTGTLVPSPPLKPQGDGAAGGVIATAMDLARFDVALTTGRLLSAASRAEMWTPTVTAAGDTLPYGIGWFVKDVAGERLLWHTGLWEGAYSALYLKAPDRHVTLVLLANSDGLRWDSRLDEAEPLRSPFVRAFLQMFAK
jgi:CubicO group peptidase (beta-lactamase class C family)